MVPTQNIVPAALQEELDQRIAASNGKISSVRQEVQKELHTLEAQQNGAGASQTTQVQVALLLAEIRYLDYLTNAAHEEAPKRSVWQRIGSMFAHKDA